METEPEPATEGAGDDGATDGAAVLSEEQPLILLVAGSPTDANFLTAPLARPSQSELASLPQVLAQRKGINPW